MASLRRILSSDGGYLTTTPPSPIIAPSPVSTVELTDSSSKSNKHLTFILLAVASVVAACFLLLTYYIVLLRHRSYNLDRRRRQTRSLTPNPNTNHDFDDGNDDAHHVWYIRTAGLDDAAINSIPFFSFDGCEGAIDGSNCSVCLSEFEKGELVRLLPKCCHAFHAPCIDMWLSSHVNCPLCRVPVVASGAVGTEEPSPAIGIHGNVADDDVVLSNPLEMPLGAGGVEEGGIGENQGGSLFVDNVDGGGGSSSSILEPGFRAKSDLGRTGGSQPGDSDQDVCDIRRSNSMSSPIVGGFFSVPVEVEENLKRQQGDCTEEEDHKQKDAVETQTMVSGNGGNSSSSFLSLFKGRSSSIMPL